MRTCCAIKVNVRLMPAAGTFRHAGDACPARVTDRYPRPLVEFPPRVGSSHSAVTNWQAFVRLIPTGGSVDPFQRSRRLVVRSGLPRGAPREAPGEANVRPPPNKDLYQPPEGPLKHQSWAAGMRCDATAGFDPRQAALRKKTNELQQSQRSDWNAFSDAEFRCR